MAAISSAYKLKDVKCLGWCGGKSFRQKFPFDRYCTKCSKIKGTLERNLSKREIVLSTGASLPEGVEIPSPKSFKKRNRSLYRSIFA